MHPESKIFEYQQIEAFLLPQTKSLRVTLKDDFFNKEMLFELESILNWLSAHPEINSVLFNNKSDYFCKGWDESELLNMNDQKHYQTLKRVQKLVIGMFYLPQTIICDLADGAYGIGAEFSLGADFRVARKGVRISFCELENGRVNTCGGIGLLEKIVSSHFCRQWNLMPGAIKQENLIYSGLIHTLYSQSKSTLDELMKRINQQSPVCRIQAKRSLLEGMRERLDSLESREFDFATAALSQRDWQESLLAKKEQRRPHFKSVHDLSESLQENKRTHTREEANV